MPNSMFLRLRQSVFRLTYILMLSAMIGQTAWHLYKYFSGVYKTSTYGFFSEMLLNYHGGFVRRGLLGEVLFILRQIIPLNVADLVLLLYYGGFFLLVWLLLRLCVKHGWSAYLLPFPVFLYLYLCDPYIMAGKRDCIILLMSYLGFFLYRHYIDNRSFAKLLIVNLWLVMAFLIHEAFFFFGAVVILFHSFCFIYRKTRNSYIAFCTFCLYWLPVLISLLFIVMCPGNTNGVIEVISSWEPYVDLGPADHSYLYKTVGVLSFKDVVGQVFYDAWLSPFILIIPKWPINIMILACLYYCLTRMNTIDLGLYKLMDFDNIQLSNILLLQACFIFPLSLFVFSDFARLLPYWSISSFFFFHFFSDRKEFPACLTSVSLYLQKSLDGCKICHNQWLYWCVLLLLPIGWFGASITGILPFIPNELKHILIGVEMTVNY